MELRGGLPGGRRELRLRVGALSVAVAEIPGRCLTEGEWHDVQTARRSYDAMWGGGGADTTSDDPLDGRGRSPYDTRHYLAWVRDGDDAAKLVTMRKVAIVPSRLSAGQRSNPGDLLPSDVRFWRVRRPDGRGRPLWDVLRAHARLRAPHDRWPEYRIASLGRIGTFPYGDAGPERRRRERTGIGFAAIQLLSTHGDPSLLYMCSICPELRDRVMGVRDATGRYLAPPFTRSEEVLGLPADSIGMDNGLPLVREHKARFPGYFVDNADAARVLAELLDAGRVRAAELRGPILRAVEEEEALGRDTCLVDELAALLTVRDHPRMAEVLTRPRLFKHLAPLLASRPELARLVVDGTRDGPYSSTMVPAAWAAGAWAILETAESASARARPAAAAELVG
jgi:hypothetical protein